MKKLWDVKRSEQEIEKGYALTFEEFLDNWYHQVKYKKKVYDKGLL